MNKRKELFRKGKNGKRVPRGQNEEIKKKLRDDRTPMAFRGLRTKSGKEKTGIIEQNLTQRWNNLSGSATRNRSTKLCKKGGEGGVGGTGDSDRGKKI